MKFFSKLKYFLTIIMLLAVAGIAQAAISGSDVISIDFGSTATAEANWNTSLISTTSNLVRRADGANTEVHLTITATAGGAFAAWAGFLDGSAQGGSSVSTIYSDGIINGGTGDDEITLTFTGLSDSLTYNLFAGGKTPGTDFGADWDISTSADGGTNQETRFQDTVSYVSFTNITSVGGAFTLTINDISDAGAPASGRNMGISELTLTAITPPSTNSWLELAQDTLSLDLYAPDTTTNGTITASFVAGTITSNDIEILTLVASNGFSAVWAPTNILSTSNLTEDIIVTYTNAGALINHGDTTNATMVVSWTEAGSSVTNSTNAVLDVTYNDPPPELQLGQTTLSLILNAPDATTNGTIVASHVIPLFASNDIDIVSIGLDSGFTAYAASSNLTPASANTDITVTYTNAGALARHGDETNSTLVVSWTVQGSSVTNTANAALDVFYVKPLTGPTLCVYEHTAGSTNPVSTAGDIVTFSGLGGSIAGHTIATTIDQLSDNIDLADIPSNNFNSYFYYSVSSASGNIVRYEGISLDAFAKDIDRRYQASYLIGGSNETFITSGQVVAGLGSDEGNFEIYDFDDFKTAEPVEFRVYWQGGPAGGGYGRVYVDDLLLYGRVEYGTVITIQ